MEPIHVEWPRGAAHTSVTSVMALARKIAGGAETWQADGLHVYIGMPGRSADAYGIQADNPTVFGKPWPLLKDPRGWRYAYLMYLVARLKDDPEFRTAVKSLHGKILVCWCKESKSRGEDPDCHGDLLAYAAERLAHEGE